MKLSQIFKTEPSSLTFLSIDSMLWVDFLDILKTLQYTRIAANPRKKYTEAQLAECERAWTALQDEVFLLEDTADARAFIKKSMDRTILSARIRLIEADANTLVWFGNHEEFFATNGRSEDWVRGIQKIYAMIKDHDSRIKLQYFEPIQANLKTLERVVASLINEYNTKHKDVEDKTSKKERSLDYEVHQINVICPGIGLVAKTMTCSQWIEAKKLAKELSKPTSKPE